MMKLVSHAPVDAAADQVERVSEIVTMTWAFLSQKYPGEIRFTSEISIALPNL